jgi:hypothetical protein
MSNTPTAADNTVVTIYNNCDDGSGCCSGGGGGGGGGDCCDGGGGGDHSNLSGVYAGYFDDGSGSNFRANFTLFADGNVSLNSFRQSFAVPGMPFETLQSLAPSVGRWSVFNGSKLRILLTSLGQDAVNAQERRSDLPVLPEADHRRQWSSLSKRRFQRRFLSEKCSCAEDVRAFFLCRVLFFFSVSPPFYLLVRSSCQTRSSEALSTQVLTSDFPAMAACQI